MARFCNKCGKEIPDGISFCNECGTPVPVQKAPVQPQPSTQGEPPVSTGYFFGMMLVYAIPVVGWIACILTALKGKHQTKKHFAKAMMIWLIIGLVLSLIAGIVLTWIGTVLIDYINELAVSELGEGGQLTEFQDLINQLSEYENGEMVLPVE